MKNIEAMWREKEGMRARKDLMVRKSKRKE